MKKRNNNVEIFSTSALDLFASAMGAFIVIAVILFPYYRNITPLLAEIDALKQSVSEKEQENKDLQQQVKDAQVTVLLGISTKATRLVILMDMSGSMNGYNEAVEKTTAQILGGLEDRHSVQVIGFQEVGGGVNLPTWNTGRNLTAVSPQNKKNLAGFLDGLTQSFDGGTPTEAALQEALEYDAEAIILLTDGQPSNGGSLADMDGIVNRITAQNKDMEIHTVAIGEYYKEKKFVTFLSNLANRNNGEFIGIAP